MTPGAVRVPVRVSGVGARGWVNRYEVVGPLALVSVRGCGRRRTLADHQRHQVRAVDPITPVPAVVIDAAGKRGRYRLLAFVVILAVPTTVAVQLTVPVVVTVCNRLIIVHEFVFAYQFLFSPVYRNHVTFDTHEPSITK